MEKLATGSTNQERSIGNSFEFQKLLGDINWLWLTTGLTTQELNDLFQTLEGDTDLNSPRKSSAEPERELALVEK